MIDAAHTACAAASTSGIAAHLDVCHVSRALKWLLIVRAVTRDCAPGDRDFHCKVTHIASSLQRHNACHYSVYGVSCRYPSARDVCICFLLLLCMLYAHCLARQKNISPAFERYAYLLFSDWMRGAQTQLKSIQSGGGGWKGDTAGRGLAFCISTQMKGVFEAHCR